MRDSDVPDYKDNQPHPFKVEAVQTPIDWTPRPPGEKPKPFPPFLPPPFPVPAVGWHCEPGACPVCLENADAIVPVGYPFPSGHYTPPAHDHCRCSIEPLGLMNLGGAGADFGEPDHGTFHNADEPYYFHSGKMPVYTYDPYSYDEVGDEE